LGIYFFFQALRKRGARRKELDANGWSTAHAQDADVTKKQI